MCRKSGAVFIVLLATASVSGSAPSSRHTDSSAQPRYGQTKDAVRQETAWRHRQREVPDDPPAAAEVLKQRRTEPGRAVTVGAYTSVQVNVDAAGNNIIGDAANEPSIAIDPNDLTKMAIGWRQFDTIESNFRQAGHAYTTDRGATWTFPGVLDPGVFRSDPVLAHDADGNFYYSSLTVPYAVDVYKSTDGGMTWPTSAYAFGGDKQWMTVDDTTGIGRGNIYQQWRVIYGCCPPFDFTRSTDGGQSFGPFEFAPSLDITTLDVDPDGVLYLAGWGWATDTEFLVAKSTNAQDPSQTPTPDFISGVPNGAIDAPYPTLRPNPGGLLGQVWVATDHSPGPTRGNVYVLGPIPAPGDGHFDVVFLRSTDGAVTWSEPILVNSDPAGTGAWQWFGTMSVAPNGRIDVVWNDTRRTGVVNLSELFYAFSNDAGDTWSGNIVIGPAFDSWVGWPNQSKIGDYYDMISFNDGAYLSYAATYNGEQDVYFLRIPADCNDNGVDDSVDISAGASADCNGNDVPDECEINEDCNENGVRDICEVAPPVNNDCNGNMIPDDCEPYEDCNANGVQDLCDLAGSTSEDCNDNAIPDECDISAGTSLDCNSNIVPDECEDCNENGVADECDITGETSQDCNDNLLPDECEDCNENGVADECDITGETSQDCNNNLLPDECEDCNENGVADECDIANETSQDCNLDGWPDECRQPTQTPMSESPHVAKNRYLTIASAIAFRPTAMSVKFTSVPGHEYADGRTMWIQEPFEVTELSGSAGSTPSPTFLAATLGCTPYYTYWRGYGTVDVYADAIVPGATFEVRAIEEGCPPDNPDSYSDPLIESMSPTGDLVGPSCASCPCTPPQNVVDYVDISAVVDKFKNLECVAETGSGVPRKAQADLINSNTTLPMPDRIVDFLDISYCVDAFRGQADPLPGPPAEDPCARR